jgi:transcriptional antiterminator RfaH
MDWYLLQTKPRQEFRAYENLNNQGFKCFLPTLAVEKLSKKSLKIETEPLFSRYVFIHLDQISSNWFPIKSTRGVQQFVRFGIHNDPVQVPNAVISQLQDLAPALNQPKSLFEQGQSVMIQDGPFKGRDAEFAKLIQEPSGEVRALVFINLLHQSIPLKIDANFLRNSNG